MKGYFPGNLLKTTVLHLEYALQFLYVCRSFSMGVGLKTCGGGGGGRAGLRLMWRVCGRVELQGGFGGSCRDCWSRRSDVRHGRRRRGDSGRRCHVHVYAVDAYAPASDPGLWTLPGRPGSYRWGLDRSPCHCLVAVAGGLAHPATVQWQGEMSRQVPTSFMRDL